MMAWVDMQIANPEVLPWLALPALLGVLILLAPKRHGRGVVLAAGLLRSLVIGVLVLALAGFVIVSEQESRFEPEGTWALVLPGARKFRSDARDFREPSDVFVTRVRNALAGEHPPALTEVHGPRAQALATRDALLALGMPCVAYPVDDADADQSPILTTIRAPRAVKPGEPFTAEFPVAGSGGALEVSLDGKSLEVAGNKIEIRVDQPGRHVIETVLKDAQGVELQRSGHVFRVGEWPRVLAIGLDEKQLKRARELVPDMRVEGVAPGAFRAADLRHEDRAIELAFASVDSLNRLSNEQASALAMFVARGGGLLVTGDGAKYVAPEYLPRDVSNLLPVMLQKEGRKPPPEDRDVEEQPIKAEIAKVSMCFVLDRSYSMNQTIGRSGIRRWKVAMEGVVKSLELVDQGGRRDAEDKSSEAYATRIGVMAFNLKQHWVYPMNPALRFNRGQIKQDLERIGDELTQVDIQKDFDKQWYNTDIYAAMKNAIEVMQQEKSAVKVIVMLTDGADRAENTKAGLKHEDLRRLAMANDINIVTVGIGDEFDDTSSTGRAARIVIKELATRDEFVNIAVDEGSALKADAIFVESVETAFEAYDDKKKRDEEERKRKAEENKDEPVVDVMPGTFPLVLTAAGEQLFGRDALPEPAPKVGWVARNRARDGAAVALAVETPEGVLPALAFLSYGLGRVGFWGAGTDPEALGELTGWTEFPGLFAGSMRWLLPREEPDVRLLAEATPHGVRILDPLDHADYVLRTAAGDVPLTLTDGVLVGENTLPLGAGEIIERVATDETTLERGIGDVFVAVTPPVVARQAAIDVPPKVAPLVARSPEVTTFMREAETPILYLLLIAMLLMPIERLVRRRS